MRKLLTLILLLSVPALCQQAPTVQERLGYPATARLLIIHADDLGMAHTVNRATMQALENHWITSASILVPCPWFPEVVRWAKAHPDADLGIHLALNSEWTDMRWGPVLGRTAVPTLVDDAGYFPLDPSTFRPNMNMNEVRSELQAQIDRARNAGISISHLDTHMAALMSMPDLFRVYEDLAHENHLPMMFERTGTHQVPAGLPVPEPDALIDRVITMEPGVPASGWLDWYKKQLAPLKPGVYQMIVHLAYDDDEMRGATSDHPDWGSRWRQSDLDLVRSPEFQQFLRDQGFVLIGWKKLQSALRTQ